MCEKVIALRKARSAAFDQEEEPSLPSFIVFIIKMYFMRFSLFIFARLIARSQVSRSGQPNFDILWELFFLYLRGSMNRMLRFQMSTAFHHLTLGAFSNQLSLADL